MNSLRTRALGLDLAWGSRATTGACALEATTSGWRVVSRSGRLSDVEAVLAWVCEQAGARGVPAIDAPLFVLNPTGSRDCDRQITRVDRMYRIGVLFRNLRLLKNGDRGRIMRRRLETELGFREATTDVAQTRTYFETYVLVAIVDVPGSSDLMRCKQGRVADRRAGLAQLASGIRECLSAARPSVSPDVELDGLLLRTWSRLRGRELKAAEDEIDAPVCAYAVARWASRDREGGELCGTPRQGILIFPRGVEASGCQAPVAKGRIESLPPHPNPLPQGEGSASLAPRPWGEGSARTACLGDDESNATHRRAWPWHAAGVPVGPGHAGDLATSAR